MVSLIFSFSAAVDFCVGLDYFLPYACSGVSFLLLAFQVETYRFETFDRGVQSSLL